MSIDLSQPAPRARTLEEAQVLVDELWSVLRAQAQQIEGRIEELACQIQERDRQIAALTARLQTLEERLHTNSRNSSTSPSTDPHRPPAKKPPSGKKPGAQPGHPGKARTLLPPDQVTHAHDCQPGACPACGGAVCITGLCARHQVIDLPPIEKNQCRKARIQRNHIACAMLVWLRLTDLARQSQQTVYRIKHGLLDNYLCQQLKNPSVKMRFA